MLQMHVLFKPVHAEGQVSGKYLLSDLRLDYLAMKKRLAQVDTADSLVKAYLKWFCKDVRAATTLHYNYTCKIQDLQLETTDATTTAIAAIVTTTSTTVHYHYPYNN